MKRLYIDSIRDLLNASGRVLDFYDKAAESGPDWNQTMDDLDKARERAEHVLAISKADFNELESMRFAGHQHKQTNWNEPTT